MMKHVFHINLTNAHYSLALFQMVLSDCSHALCVYYVCVFLCLFFFFLFVADTSIYMKEKEKKRWFVTQ